MIPFDASSHGPIKVRVTVPERTGVNSIEIVRQPMYVIGSLTVYPRACSDAGTQSIREIAPVLLKTRPFWSELA
jgi:hypothetical protein